MGRTAEQEQTTPALAKWAQALWSSLFSITTTTATTTTTTTSNEPLECPADFPLPLTVPEITPAFLSRILQTPITALTITQTLHGSATKLLLTTTPPYHDTPLCIKGGFNPDLVAHLPGLLAVYRLEAQFYRHIAPRIPGLRLIESYWQGVDHPSGVGQGIVVLRDVQAAGYTFGDPLTTWPVERVKEALVQLARLHAATWGAKQAEMPWVPREFGMRDVITEMMSPQNWSARFSSPTTRPPDIPESLYAHRTRVVACLQTLWAHVDASTMLCMVHGDTQLGNTFLSPKGTPGFLDWQCVHRNSAAHDVTYFLSGALTVADRRTHERALWAFYLRELEGAGGPRLGVDETWDEYRMYQMQGFAWALAGPMMQPKEVVDAISARHCAAIIDHQSMELLESIAEAARRK